MQVFAANKRHKITNFFEKIRIFDLNELSDEKKCFALENITVYRQFPRKYEAVWEFRKIPFKKIKFFFSVFDQIWKGNPENTKIKEK